MASVVDREVAHLVMKLMHTLVVPGVRPEELSRAAEFLQPVHFGEVTDERSCSGMCGWPLCSNVVDQRQQPKQKYKISRSRRTVYDISDRVRYCCEACMVESSAYKKSLSQVRAHPFAANAEITGFLRTTVEHASPESLSVTPTVWQEPIAGRPKVQQLLRMQKQQQHQQQQNATSPSAAPSSSQKEAEPPPSTTAAPPTASQPAAEADQPKEFEMELNRLFDALDTEAEGHLEEPATREIEATLEAGWPAVERERLLALLRPSGGTRVYREGFSTFFTEAALYLFEQLVKGTDVLSGDNLREISEAMGLEHEAMMSAGFPHLVIGKDLSFGLPKHNFISFLVSQLATISRKASAIDKLLYLAGSRPKLQAHQKGAKEAPKETPKSSTTAEKKKKKKKLSPIPTVTEAPVGLVIKERAVAAPPKPMLNAGGAKQATEKKPEIRPPLRSGGAPGTRRSRNRGDQAWA